MTAQTSSYISGPALDEAISTRSGETLVELLDKAATRTPASIALTIRRGMADERWTYQQLVERSVDIAATLREAGLEHGDRVLTWSQNDPWLVAAYFGTWRAGGIIVPLDLRMQTDVAVRIGKRTLPKLLLVGEGANDEAVVELGVPTLTVNEAGLIPAPSPTSIERNATSRDVAPGQAVAPDDVAEILFTSGTTSDPKGVVLTHGQIVHSARAIAQTGMGPEPERALAIIPMSHMYGQSVPLLMGLISGSTLVFLQSLSPKAIAATMKRERVTAITLVPQLMEIILAGIEAEARRGGREEQLQRARRIARYLPFGLRRLLFRSVHSALGGHLSIISSGGARLDEELQAAWEAMGILVVQGYGTTECAAICGHSRAQRRSGSVGPPLAGLEVRIADDSELLARGPNVMQGYWQADDATAEVLDAEGWFHTGDAAAIDDEGEIVILGRTRDRIALPNGLNVYPEDVEAALHETRLVSAAVVFEATPGKLAAALVPAAPDATDDDLGGAVRQANQHLAPHQRLTGWRRWPDDDFPRTHTLKVRRGPVEAWYREDGTVAPDAAERAGGDAPPRETKGQAAAADSVTMESLLATIAAALLELRGADAPAVSAETKLGDLGLDSLDTVALALHIDEAYDAPLSDDEVAAATDIVGLLELVRQRQGQPPAPEPSAWAFSRPARLFRGFLDATLAGWLVKAVADPQVEGLEHFAGIDGPVLICPNHLSHLDAPTVRASLPPAVRERLAIAAAADTFFDGNPIGPVVALVQGALPFGRTTDVRASLEHVADLVADGSSVMIFPEGTRSRDGRLGPMRSGIGLLATNLRVPVVPVHIDGTWEILPPGAGLPSHRQRRSVRVRFGAPISAGTGTTLRDATEQIGAAIEALGAPADGDQE